MDGRIDSPEVILILALISAIAVITDLWHRKIYNWTTFPAMALGLFLMGLSGGVHGFLQSLAGMGVGFLCFGFFFALRWFGAGDVKLLMAFGAWGGPRYGFEVALLSVILGGVLAIVFLIVTGRIFDFGKRFYHFIRSILIRELAYEPFQADRRLRLPFAIPLAIAAIAQALSNPLQQLGLNWLEVWHG